MSVVDPQMIADATGDAPSEVDRELDACAECGIAWPHDPTLPPCMVVDGVRMQWCSEVCHDAWMDADPARRAGWVSVDELTPAQVRDVLARAGIAVDGPDRQPS